MTKVMISAAAYSQLQHFEIDTTEESSDAGHKALTRDLENPALWTGGKSRPVVELSDEAYAWLRVSSVPNMYDILVNGGSYDWNYPGTMAIRALAMQINKIERSKTT